MISFYDQFILISKAVKTNGFLAFDASAANAPHDVLAEEDEEEEKRHRDEDGRGHLIAIFDDARVDINEA